MLNRLLKRLCPCYFVESDDCEHLCGGGTDRVSADATASEQMSRNDEKGFLIRENCAEQNQEESSVWKGTLSLVKPQPMYTVPYDVKESPEYSEGLLTPILYWAKSTKHLSAKGPPICQEFKIHKKKLYVTRYKNTKLQTPLTSNSEIMRLKRCGTLREVCSVKTEKTFELQRFKSTSLQDVPFEASSKRKQELEYKGAGDGDDKWYFTKDYQVYPDVSHGVVLFTAVYFDRKNVLLINVHRLENLSKKGREGFSYHTILKASILPLEKHSKSSKVLDRCSHPKIEEDFTFRLKDLTDKVLRLSVFDASLRKSCDAVGHALLHLENAVFGHPKKYRMKLYKRSQPHVTPGNLLLSLSYKSEAKKFVVVIDKAKNLKLQNDKYAKLSSYVKVSLHSYGKKIKCKKSLTVTDSRDPNYNCTFTFLVDEDHVDHLSILVAVKLKSFIKDVTLGNLILGPFFVEEEQKLTPWGRIFLKNEVVSRWFRMYL